MGKKNKHILVFTNYFYPEIGGATNLLLELCTDMVELGNKVTVITNFPNYHVQNLDNKYTIKALTLDEKINGITVKRIKGLPYGNNFILRGLNHLSCSLTFLFRALFCKNYDGILIFSPPIFLSFTGVFLKKLHKVPVITNVQDIFPQNAIDLGVLHQQTLIKIFEKVEILLYKTSKYLTVHSTGNKKFLVENKNLSKDKVVVINNWIDTNFMKPGPKENDFAKEHELSDKFIVLFAGVLGWSQGLEIILDCANLLKDKKDIIFLIIGEGPVKKALIEKTRKDNIDNVKFLPLQPYKKYPLVVNSSDVCLVTLSDKVKTPVVPSKILGYMSSGKPIVAAIPKISDGNEIINEAKCGFCMQPHESEKMAESILKLNLNKELKNEMGENGRSFAVEKLERKKNTEKYNRLFNELLGIDKCN